MDRLDDVTEEDLGGERVAVVDDRLLVGPVPAVHCRGQRSAGHERSWGQ